jgi:hypothetical protein
VCDQLLDAGSNVTLVSRFDRFPARVAGSTPRSDMSTGPGRERLLSNERFQFISDSCLVEITDSDVEITLVHPSARPTRRLAADTVVMIGYNLPNRELVDALADAGPAVHVIGDAAGSRTLRTAIRHGANVGRTLVGTPA